MKRKFLNYLGAFIPQTVTMFNGYSGKKLVRDLLSGLIVGVIALPLSIALAIASGAPPAAGLVTAVVAGLTAAVFSGSAHQVTGPTGAFVVVVLATIAEYTYAGLLAATFFAGIMIIIMGLLRLGRLVDYIAKPIITGFTTGIAVTIFTTQVVDFFSIQPTLVSSEFFDKWAAYFAAANTINFTAFGIAAGCAVFMFVWQKLKIKVPGALIAIVASSVIVTVFKLDVPTVGSKFGEITMELDFNLPFSGLNLVPLLKPALTLALLAAIESLLSAKAAEAMTKVPVRNDMELLSQGLANIVSSCFGGLPATGAIARTSANIKNGGVSPVSVIVHALFLLAAGLLLSNLVKFVPLGALAAALVMVCINMVEVREIKKVFKSSVTDMLLFVTTFILTVVFDLVVAIAAGVGLSFVLFAIRTIISKATKDKFASLKINVEGGNILIGGTLNFFTAQNLIKKVEQCPNAWGLNAAESLTVCAADLDSLDINGMDALDELKTHFERRKKRVFLESPEKRIRL